MVKVNHIILGACLFVIFAIQNAEAGENSGSVLKTMKKAFSLNKESKGQKSSKRGVPNLPRTKSSKNDDSNSISIKKTPVIDNVLPGNTPSPQFQENYTSYGGAPSPPFQDTPYTGDAVGYYPEDNFTSILENAYETYAKQQEEYAQSERERAEEEKREQEYQEYVHIQNKMRGLFDY